MKEPDSSYNSPSLNSVNGLSTSPFYKLQFLRRIKKNIQDFFISINTVDFLFWLWEEKNLVFLI